MSAPHLIWLDGVEAPILVVVERIVSLEAVLEKDRARQVVTDKDGNAVSVGTIIHLETGTTFQVSDPLPEVAEKITTATLPGAPTIEREV